jgi:hypothetical protein
MLPYDIRPFKAEGAANVTSVAYALVDDDDE